ncbi:MAG: transporter [Bdellovibrionales bacterium]
MGSITGGLNAVLPTLGTALTAAKFLEPTVKGRADDYVALKHLQQQQAESLRQAKEDAALRKAEIRANADEAERKRRDALKRSVARQRAQFGSQGISTNNGSGQAILLGLFDESDDERAQRERLDGLRTSALDQNVSQQSRLNLLQASQLAEKQRVRQAFSDFDQVTKLL